MWSLLSPSSSLSLTVTKVPRMAGTIKSKDKRRNTPPVGIAPASSLSSLPLATVAVSSGDQPAKRKAGRPRKLPLSQSSSVSPSSFSVISKIPDAITKTKQKFVTKSKARISGAASPSVRTLRSNTEQRIPHTKNKRQKTSVHMSPRSSSRLAR